MKPCLEGTKGLLGRSILRIHVCPIRAYPRFTIEHHR